MKQILPTEIFSSKNFPIKIHETNKGCKGGRWREEEEGGKEKMEGREEEVRKGEQEEEGGRIKTNREKIKTENLIGIKKIQELENLNTKISP